MMTLIGIALLFLLLVGLYSSLRVSAQPDVMSAWQRRALLRERHSANPDLARRHP